jgi:hypothetical protein
MKMNAPKLYNKQTGKEVPSVKGVVESATAVGTYQSMTDYDGIARFFRSLVDIAATQAGLHPKNTDGYEYAKKMSQPVISSLNEKTTGQKLGEFIQALTGKVPRNLAFGRIADQLKINVNGLEVRLEGDDTCYFVNNGFYRLNRGEQVVLYSEFLPGGLADRPEVKALLGADKPKIEEPEKEKRICVVGLQVIDEQGVLFSDIMNPDMDVFSDKPPTTEKPKLKRVWETP